MLGEFERRPVDWMQLASGRRHLAWMQADAATHQIAQRLSVLSLWAQGRTIDGPKHHNTLLEAWT
ncbi:hypothetical protein [Hyalangium minutum]|nr:hypothetical protein [Hyalangium minutum]